MAAAAADCWSATSAKLPIEGREAGTNDCDLQLHAPAAFRRCIVSRQTSQSVVNAPFALVVYRFSSIDDMVVAVAYDRVFNIGRVTRCYWRCHRETGPDLVCGKKHGHIRLNKALRRREPERARKAIRDIIIGGKALLEKLPT